MLRKFWHFPKAWKCIQANVTGIKCDMPSCDFRDDTARPEHYKQWLNRPCPKCNGNLLTQRDYDYFNIFDRLCAVMNWLLLPVGVFSWVKSKITRKPIARTETEVRMDGRGAAGVQLVCKGEPEHA